MSKVKLLWAAVITLIIVNFAVVAFLFIRKMPPPHMRHEGPKNIIIERLRFDEEQISAYEKLIRKHRNDISNLEEQIRQNKNDLYLTLSDTLHTGKDSLQSLLGNLQQQIEAVHYNHFADIRKLCKPDQLTLFTELTHDLAEYFAPGKKMLPPPKD